MNTSLLVNDICAVVTTFDLSEGLISRVLNVIEQVDYLIVVDDSGNDNSYFFKELVGNGRFHYFARLSNDGIAQALNDGIVQAAELGYKYVLTLDDDTDISSDYVSRVLEFKNSTSLSAAVIACSRDGDSGASLSRNYNLKRAVITSGSLISLEAFFEVGGFSNDLFIDLVDFDYCFRVRERGYSVVQLSYMGMKHKVGMSRIVRLPFFSITIYNHSPFRLYYQTRNTFYFFFRFINSEFFYSFYLVLDLLRIPLKILFFEKDKKLRFKYYFLGIFHGIKKQYGKLR